LAVYSFKKSHAGFFEETPKNGCCIAAVSAEAPQVQVNLNLSILLVTALLDY
jgi:hypothetical protein